MTVYYQDNEIIIREICSKDVINLFSCWIDKEINVHDPRPMPNNSKELIQECAKYCKRFDMEIVNKNIEDRKYKYFIIVNTNGNFIGFVNLFNIDRVKKQGEMGVIIGDKIYWNKGIAYRAVKVAMEYIFNNMEIERIYIETAANNEPALRLFKKLEFKKCGEYLEDNNFKFVIMDKQKASF